MRPHRSNAQFIELHHHGRFESGKRKIQIAAVEQRARQLERIGIALGRERRQRGPTGIAEPKHLGRLIEGLARSVINGFAQQGLIPDTGNCHQLCVPAILQERHKRKFRGVRT